MNYNSSIKHYNIPIFLPEIACSHICVFCNQKHITGKHALPSSLDIVATINNSLETMQIDSFKTIAFFGGSFTALPLSIQNSYLSIAYEYLEKNLIQGIRLSTRPDYINQEIIKNLKQFGVSHIELGAQSCNNTVLQLSQRGHTVDTIKKASDIILQNNISLGLQMMIGLPGDTKEFALETAHKIVEFGAHETRIYPTLVIEDTQLAQLFRNNHYTPLSLNTAVEWCSQIFEIFTLHNVKILKVGLHPFKDLENNTSFIAGPYHPNFREMVMSEYWKNKISRILKKDVKYYTISTHPYNVNWIQGFNSVNKKYFTELGIQIKIITDSTIKIHDFSYCYN